MFYSPILALHISAGMTGILSGAAAMTFRKGSPRHVLAGKVFVVAMLTMAASAVYLAVVTHDNNNIGGGVLTLYLVTTAWLTARRRDGETSRFDGVVLLVPLALGILTWMNGLKVVRSGASSQNGVPVGMAFFMGSVMLLAAAGDVRMLLRGGLFGTQRLLRHLWRMCFGLFIATGSFFLGQGAKIFSSWWRQSSFLIIPAVLPLILLVFWVIRVRFTSAHKNKSTPHTEVLSTP